VAWLLPELDEGAEPELKPLELELELELEPVELEPDEVEPEPVEPELADEPEPELAEVPVDDEPDDAEEEEAVLCVDPGRASATMPAAATLAMVTVVVADRTRARPRSLSAMARRTRSRCALLMCPILRSRTRSLLYEPSRLAMRRTACLRRPRLTLPRQHEGQLKARYRVGRPGGPDRDPAAGPVDRSMAPGSSTIEPNQCWTRSGLVTRVGAAGCGCG
jgi:hypothetical protein